MDHTTKRVYSSCHSFLSVYLFSKKILSLALKSDFLIDKISDFYLTKYLFITESIVLKNFKEKTFKKITRRCVELFDMRNKSFNRSDDNRFTDRK